MSSTYMLVSFITLKNYNLIVDWGNLAMLFFSLLHLIDAHKNTKTTRKNISKGFKVLRAKHLWRKEKEIIMRYLNIENNEEWECG